MLSVQKAAKTGPLKATTRQLNPVSAVSAQPTVVRLDVCRAVTGPLVMPEWPRLATLEVPGDRHVDGARGGKGGQHLCGMKPMQTAAHTDGDLTENRDGGLMQRLARFFRKRS